MRNRSLSELSLTEQTFPEFQSPLTVAERLGLNPRWLVANRGQMDLLFREILGLTVPSKEDELAVDQAVLLVRRAKQNAIKQFSSHGLKRLENSLLENCEQDEEEASSALVDRVSNIMGLGIRQTQRYLRTLGLVPEKAEDEDTIDYPDEIDRPTPQILKGNSEIAERNLVHEIGLDHLLLLASGYGADFHELVPRPYQFAANTASLLLRMKFLSANPAVKQREAEFTQRKSYPAIPWAGFPMQPTAPDHVTPETAMSLFGLCLWRSGMLRSNTLPQSGGFLVDTSLYPDLVRLAVRETPWVFPELVASTAVREAAQDLVYWRIIERAVRLVANSVGSALLGTPPYVNPLQSR